MRPVDGQHLYTAPCEIQTKFLSVIKDRYPNANPIEKEEIESKFKRVGTAYETLKNEREDYDDFLQNPEQAYYKYYQYYRNGYESILRQPTVCNIKMFTCNYK